MSLWFFWGCYNDDEDQEATREGLENSGSILRRESVGYADGSGVGGAGGEREKRKE